MKFDEIRRRITGFSIPVFGVSWNPPEPEIMVARRVVAFLEDRRVLYNPHHLEIEWQCVESVTDIRRVLTEEIGRLYPRSDLAAHLRAIRAACRRFLDAMSDPADVPGRGWRGPFEAGFLTALGELRAAIGLHVAALATMYGLDVEGPLADALPAADETDS